MQKNVDNQPNIAQLPPALPVPPTEISKEQDILMLKNVDNQPSIAQLPPALPAAGRVARRRAVTREKILEASSRLFWMAGFDAVNFEDIADAADVARGTLYSFFQNKDALIDSMLKSLYQRALQGMERIKTSDPVKSIEELLNLYCDLWEADPGGLRVANDIHAIPSSSSEKLYNEFVRKVEELFRGAERRGLLRSGDPVVSTRLFSKTTFPSLEVFSGEKDYRTLFIDHIKHLLLIPRESAAG